MFNYSLKYSDKMSGFQSLKLSGLRKYTSLGVRYEIDSHLSLVLICGLSQYATKWNAHFERSGYRGGDIENYDPACYILAATGNDKAIYLLVPVIDWGEETGIRMIVLATLIMGHETSFQIEKRKSILVDPKALYEMGEKLKRQTAV